MTAVTARVQAYRRRKKEGSILLPRIEISNELADNLVQAGLLGDWSTEDPQAIAAAIIQLLETLGNDVS